MCEVCRSRAVELTSLLTTTGLLKVQTSLFSFFLPGVLHEEALDEHRPRQGPQRRRHLPLPPGAAQAPEGLPQVHEGRGRTPGGTHLQGQVRGLQAGAAELGADAQGAGAYGPHQEHVSAGKT